MSNIKKPSIYVLGIAGTGTGALAGLLKSAGHHVRGVDSAAYPPMREKLQEWGIEVALGFDAGHLTPPPELVIVGNVIRRTNVEATYVREHGLPSMSMPQAIAQFAIGERHSVVVSGTHGKTTTTALIAHVLLHAGLDPGFLVGGALVGQRDSFRMGAGPFVIEGDEYDTAYFDKEAKFLHYRARTLVITSLEFDHADIYADVQAIEAAFAKLIAGMPSGGHVVVWRQATRALRLLASHGTHLQVTVYDACVDRSELALPAEAPANSVLVWANGIAVGADGTSVTVRTATNQTAAAATTLAARVPLWGEFGAQNAIAAIAVARALAVADDAIVQALATFKGVHRRLEEKATIAGRLFIDDFAHHPTAVAATLQAARQRYPNRRLWAIFEPRSATSRRNVFFEEYKRAFAHADVVLLANHARLAEVDAAQRFDRDGVVAALQAAGTCAAACETTNAIVDCVAQRSQAGDVVLLLSNGDFDGLLPQLMKLTFASPEAASPWTP